MRGGLGERHASSQLVFPGIAGTPFAGWSKAKVALEKAIMARRAKSAQPGGRPLVPLTPWNVHVCTAQSRPGCRGSASDLRSPKQFLNHISGSRGGIAGVYQRHDWAAKKRAALDAWAEHVILLVEGAGAGNIVVFERGR